VQSHRRFWYEVGVPRCGRISSHNVILKWVDDFSVCVSVVNKPVGLACSVYTPENNE
jgi:hypothetical protein